MKKITPLYKGLITGIALLAISLFFYLVQPSVNSAIQSAIIYGVYAAGILWTLIDYARSEAYTGKFGDLFGQGFRCFIVVTLIMVVFIGFYFKLHPEFAEESASAYRKYLIEDKNTLPADINTKVAEHKKQFNTVVVSGSILGYLISGVVFTVGGAALILLRRK